ncbi:MAG: DUF2341 domain-containing protein [Pseudomonas sp.]
MADQYQSNVSLLLHCDGTNGSTTLLDQSGFLLAPACKGTAALSTAQKQFGTASLKTGNANGNYAVVGSSLGFNFGSVDFTVEAFVWPVSQGADGGAIIGRWDGAGAGTDWLIWRGANGEVNVSVNGAQLIAGASGDLPTGAFAHVALTRAGSAWQVWVGGVAKGSATLAGAVNTTAGINVALGQSNFTAGTTWLEAYYDEVRITKGVARYTAGFTPTAVPFAALLIDYHNLLLPCEGADNSTTIVDSTPMGRKILAFNNAKISTANPKFGNSALRFSGSMSATQNQDYVDITVNDAQLSQSTGEFTIEMQVNMQSQPTAGNYGVLIDFRPLSTSGPYICLMVDSNGKVVFYPFNSASITSSVALAVGTYSHVALVRKGSQISLYIDGVLAGGPVSDSSSYSVAQTRIRLGASAYISGQYSLNGFLDEISILTGWARYSAPFAPPGNAYTDPPAPKPLQVKLSRILSRTLTLFSRKVLAMPTNLGRVKDVAWGGSGTVAGQVTVNNLPAQRRVALIELASMTTIRAAWSDASGNYSIPGVDATKSYLVVGRDYTKTYNAVVQDNITAVGGTVAVSARQKLRFTAGGSGLGTGYPVLIRVAENGAPINIAAAAYSMSDARVTTKVFPLTKNGDSDIKFTDTSGNELDFWLELVTGSIGDRIAFYWVKLPGDLDAGPVDIYMNYGAGVRPTKTSSGATVFPTLFDDFDGGTLDAAKWANPNGFSTVANSIMNTNSAGSPQWFNSVATYAAGLELLAAVTSFTFASGGSSAITGQFGFVSGPGSGAAMNSVAALETPNPNTQVTGSSKLAINAEAAASTNGQFTPGMVLGNSGSYSLTTTGRLALGRASDGSAALRINGQVVATRTGAGTAAAYVSLHRNMTTPVNSNTSYDWVALRKYIPSGPPILIPLTEEIL